MQRDEEVATRFADGILEALTGGSTDALFLLFYLEGVEQDEQARWAEGLLDSICAADTTPDERAARLDVFWRAWQLRSSLSDEQLQEMHRRIGTMGGRPSSSEHPKWTAEAERIVLATLRTREPVPFTTDVARKVITNLKLNCTESTVRTVIGKRVAEMRSAAE